jgi:transposase
MANKRFIVKLSPKERCELEAIVNKGRGWARKLTHARILLLADEGVAGPARTDQQIKEALGVGTATIERIRRRFVVEGLEAALNPRQGQRERPHKIDGTAEARLIALACGPPPEGQVRWTLRLLADRLVKLEVVGAVSHETVRRVLNDIDLKPWLQEEWCLPEEASAEFVCQMEEVLDLYQQPYDEKRPMVCMDEMMRQLVGDLVESQPVKPGQPKRVDYQYERVGVANLFMLFEPLGGRCEVRVTQRRTGRDWAELIRELVEEIYPQAERIVLVVDNLNTHVKASLYDAFAPEQAKRLADKVEIHYTPKHGSWLNMAEVMLSVLARQCLNRRLGSMEELKREVAAWLAEHRTGLNVDWRFTTADARIKLKRLYPSIQV